MARRAVAAAEGVVPSAGYTFSMRLQYPNQIGMLGRITSMIGAAGGDIGAVDIVESGKDTIIRDFSVSCQSDTHAHEIIAALKKSKIVSVRSVADRVFLTHQGGKIQIANKVPVETRRDLSVVYTPGVARVCMAIHREPEAVYSLTIKKNSVAVVTDGTAVLGLGDIGPEAALPVMEGKAMLFKGFGDVDAWPLCLDTKDPDEIVEIVKAIAPGFGGVNLEDISAPRCFYIEERLKKEMDIPVFHDDQHGTAVVVLAALINALKIVPKRIEDLKVVVSGVGAAGVACVKILMASGVQHVIGVDRAGIVYRGREEDMNDAKRWFADHTNEQNLKGSLSDAIQGADLFLGLSGPDILSVEDVKSMAPDAIVFAMANPDPEIRPELALPHVRIMATGRSDYPNQINNVLCFPGIFRGALDAQAREINEEMKIAAAHAIAATVSKNELHEEYIIPSVFNKSVFKNVAKEVTAAAYRSGAAERHRKAFAFF